MAIERVAIPWHRRSDVNTALAVIGLLVPPFLWFVCFNLITGDIYFTRRGGAGRIETWSTPNRALAYGIMGAQLLVIVLFYSSIVWVSCSSVKGRPAAEEVVSRYFDAMKRPAAGGPPHDLFGSGYWSVMSEAKHEKLVSQFYQMLGAVESFQEVGFNASTTGMIQLEYRVECEHGTARETFFLKETKPGEGIRIQALRIMMEP